MEKIRVLIVDDSTFFREVIIAELSKDQEIEIIGGSPDAEDAIIKIEQFSPDVISLDVEMPGMNGIEFLKKVMPKYTIPVIVVSSVNSSVFDALSSGALDFIAKPDSRARLSYVNFIDELKKKIKDASKANREALKMRNTNIVKDQKQSSKVIAIGASSIGTEAVMEIIRSLPRNMPGILVVQHMPPVFTEMFAQRLNNTCAIEVKEAETGDMLYPGRLFIAPGDCQMELKNTKQGYMVECNSIQRQNEQFPSIDVLFRSVADCAGNNAIGIILAGMGTDGARGLLYMRQKGAITLGQDEATSILSGMPKFAYEIGAVGKQLPLNKIADEIIDIISNCDCMDLRSKS